MSEKQKTVKMNKNLLNEKMEKKFKKAFTAINVGIIAVGVIGILALVMMNTSIMYGNASTTRGYIAIALLALVMLITLSLCSTVSKSIATAIVLPVQELQVAVQKVKNGIFDLSITYESKDELGELAEDLREACVYMHTIVADAGYLLGEMAEGRFNVSSQVEASYVGDFKGLILSMDKLNQQLDETLRQIRGASEQVMNGSEQLSVSANALADGATNQAGAIEELISTIDNITNISEDSAESAMKAAKDAKTAAEDAEKSHEDINKLTEAMARITETSKEIENIIAAIEDIADQTNLLALNASIEAARAGEAGRGFAVVADQIGKLATDSAQSAVMTRELISKSLVEVELGNQMVENTKDSINAVLANMETFASMASGVAEASQVQADMLKQIDSGIEQISGVVQSNTAAAQETSAVSEELSAQAVKLEQMVERFVLR